MEPNLCVRARWSMDLPVLPVEYFLLSCGGIVTILKSEGVG